MGCSGKFKFLPFLLIMLIPAFGLANKPQVPVDVSLTLAEEEHFLGSTDRMTFTVTAQVDSQATVRFELPADKVLAEGDLLWTGFLEKGQTKTFNLSVTFVEQGEYTLFAHVECQSGERRFGRRAELNVIATPDKVHVSSDALEIMKYEMAGPAEKAQFRKSRAVEAHTTIQDIPSARDQRLQRLMNRAMREKQAELMKARSLTDGKSSASLDAPLACFVTNPFDASDGKADGKLSIASSGMIEFDADCTSKGKIVSYRWDFGDGSPVETGARVRHAFFSTDDVAQKMVTLTVTDDRGVKSQTQIQVQVLPATTSVRVSGRATYIDVDGTVHPIRYARIDVADEDAGSYELLGTTVTSVNGTYSINVSGGDPDGPPDIFVAVSAEVINNLGPSVGADLSNGAYLMYTSTTNDASGNLTKNLQTGTPVLGGTNDSFSARIFSVYDAMLFGAAQAYDLRGSLLPPIPVVFPGSSTFYCNAACSGTVDFLSVIRADALDWDVLLHEWAHYTGDHAPSGFHDNPGGRHSGGSTTADHGKDAGMRLAWAEGWATFFSIAIQREPTGTMIPLPDIPQTGNWTYQDFEDQVINDNLEGVGSRDFTTYQLGWASEWSVMSVLYDFIDITSLYGWERQDQIDLTHRDIWNYLNAGGYSDAALFWNAIFASLGGEIKNAVEAGDIFALNNMGPKGTFPDNFDSVGGASPIFQWDPQGDPTYPNDQFYFLITPNQWQTHRIYGPITANQFEIPFDDWTNLIGEAGNDDPKFYWLVLGKNTSTAPAMSGYGFPGETRMLDMRTFRIQLEWPLLGADVDLHFVNPSGSDCYFANRNPDWGFSGDPTDNPFLDRDCISGCVLETTSLDRVTQEGTYKIVVHYYSDHGLGDTTATVRVYRFSRLIMQTSVNVTDDEWVDVFTVNTGPLGSPTLQLENRVMPAPPGKRMQKK